MLVPLHKELKLLTQNCEIPLNTWSMIDKAQERGQTDLDSRKIKILDKPLNDWQPNLELMMNGGFTLDEMRRDWDIARRFILAEVR